MLNISLRKKVGAYTVFHDGLAIGSVSKDIETNKWEAWKKGKCVSTGNTTRIAAIESLVAHS